MPLRSFSRGRLLAVSALFLGLFVACGGGGEPKPPPPPPPPPPPAAVKLAFLATALSATAGQPIDPVLEVAIQDAEGRTVTGASNEVSIQLAAGPDSAKLEGMLVVQAVNGIARFPGVMLKLAGPGYRLKATSSGLTEATSPTFEVAPGAAAQLVLTASPGPFEAGQELSLEVLARDAFGNVATGYRGTVHVTSADPAAVLPADYTFTAADGGRHTFPVVFKTAASPQQVTVTDTALSTLTATLGRVIVPGAPTQLRIASQPVGGRVRNALSPVRVELLDAFGNRSQVSGPAMSVSLKGGNPASLLSGTVTAAPVDGLATFSELFVDQEGTGFQLTVGAGALPPVDSSSFAIVDDIPPGVVTLTSIGRTKDSVMLAWTAVGDDGSLGAASTYELRYSTAPISTRAEFDAATLATSGTPQAPGSAESFTVTGLTGATTYFFAVVVWDSAGNRSLPVAQEVMTLDPCAGVVCEVPEPTCAADGITRVTFTSACVLEDNLPTCRDTETRMTCPGADGVCFAATCGTASRPEAGELTVSEVMHNPSSNTTEYIELHNSSPRLLNIAGVQFGHSVGGAVVGAFTVSRGAGHAVLVPPGGLFVLGRNEDFATNGGVPVDFAYGSEIELGAEGRITLRAVSGTLIEDFAWSSSFPQAEGRSMNLASAVVGARAHRWSWYWCDSSVDVRMLGGDYGTPGQPNETCGLIVGSAPSFCNIQHPKTFPAVVPYGSRHTVYSQFSAPDVTNRNSLGNDDSPLVQVELGHGPGTDPADWLWSPGRFNPFYDTTSPAYDPSKDEIWAWLKIFTPGTYSYGFRYRFYDPVAQSFSGYTYCDQNGIASIPASGTYGSITVGTTPLGPTDHIVISELATRGTDGAVVHDDDEFIELYNPTSTSMDIGGWKVQYMPPEATAFQELVTIPAGTTLAAKGYYLIAHTGYVGGVAPDLQYGQSLSHLAGNVRIGRATLGTGVLDSSAVDNLGWGAAYAPEGDAAPVAGAAGSLERKAVLASTAETMEGGADATRGNGIDSDWNADDFVTRTSRGPQSSASTPETP